MMRRLSILSRIIKKVLKLRLKSVIFNSQVKYFTEELYARQ